MRPDPPVTPLQVARARILVRGVVQGVGFRPFVHNLATALALAGFVRNDPGGVTIEVQGPPERVRAFVGTLTSAPPPLARIEELTQQDVPPQPGEGFAIVASEAGGTHLALISPDVATCAECLAEIRQAGARRLGYPFTNCTNCGPRFSITLGIPYDRPNTTMGGFAMCPACRAEYEDPTDRRFHAQPIACPACGPHLAFDQVPGDDPEIVQRCAAALHAGRIVALKGLGGYHLVCDAANEEAVGLLRSRKVREEKPFALMVQDLDAARRLCEVCEHEAALLCGYRRPIVLLMRRSDARDALAPSVAPRNRSVGLMLPYTPLHHLLVDAFCAGAGNGVLVMTSGNRADEPIAYTDGDAAERLGSIADVFVTHNRPIHIRCDDSVTRSFRGEEYLVRRSRGYAPEPLAVSQAFPRPVLAVGAELKHTFCLGTARRAFLSHHIGDLENWETMRSFTEGVEHYSAIFQIRPEVVAYDLHPEYLSTKWALDQVAGEGAAAAGVDLEGCELVGVQHHHAHIAACLADNNVAGPVIGLALDGTGWGPDGTIWGGEILVADLAGFRRAGHLRAVPLPGGAAAIREPWRMAASYLRLAFGEEAAGLTLPFVRAYAQRWGPVMEMAAKAINAPLTSSAGRLFDAASALAGVRGSVAYEGQAAIELEQVADPAEGGAYPCDLRVEAGLVVLDGVGLIRALAEDLMAGAGLASVAARFHNGLAAGLVAGCQEVAASSGLASVALSGGTFQNLLLLERVTAGLEGSGFTVHRHRRVPANDGGIAFGQAVVAAARLRGEG